MTVPNPLPQDTFSAASNGSAAPDASENTPLISHSAGPPSQQQTVARNVDDDDDDDDAAVHHYVTPTRAASISFSMWVLMFMQGE